MSSGPYSKNIDAILAQRFGNAQSLNDLRPAPSCPPPPLPEGKYNVYHDGMRLHLEGKTMGYCSPENKRSLFCPPYKGVSDNCKSFLITAFLTRALCGKQADHLTERDFRIKYLVNHNHWTNYQLNTLPLKEQVSSRYVLL